MSILLNYNDSDNQSFKLTLTERSLLITTGNTYEIYFTNEQSGNINHETFTDVSLFPERYNMFNIITSGNTLFSVGGWYKYEAYSNTGQTNLLEIGKCYLDDGIEDSNIYEKDESVYIYKK